MITRAEFQHQVRESLLQERLRLWLVQGKAWFRQGWSGIETHEKAVDAFCDLSASTGRESPSKQPVALLDAPQDTVYTMNELAALLKMDRSTVRRIFQDEPGVLKLGKENRRDGRRDYVSYRVPRWVVLRKFPQLKFGTR